jgi:hypothetical protein
VFNLTIAVPTEIERDAQGKNAPKDGSEEGTKRIIRPSITREAHKPFYVVRCAQHVSPE